MMKYLKILLALLILALISLLALGCAMTPKKLDELAWKQKVNSLDPKLLYAPHEKEGSFFNPWLPME